MASAETTSELPKIMLAWQKHLPSNVPVRVEVPVPSPKEDELLIKIHAAGVCHSDYAVREMNKMPPEFTSKETKWTMGHEGCGQVISLGSKVTKFKPGDMVVMMCVPGCGSSTCPDCSTGAPQVCSKGVRYGGGEDGFFTDYVAVRENATVKLAAGVSPAVGAVATDACMTAYHAVVGTAQVKKSDTVLLLGLGGLGFNALQIVQSIGARVVVLDQRQVVLDEAVKFGIPEEDVVPVGTTDVAAWVSEKALRIDVAIDFVAMPATLEAAVTSVRRGGKVTLVGLLSPELSFRTAGIVRRQISLLGSYAGTCADIEACLDLIAQGKLNPQVTTGSMKDFPSILEDLHHGKIKSRIALIPEGIV